MTVTTTEQTTPATADDDTPVQAAPTGTASATPLVTDDLLVEDVSIDGMCGVY